MEHGTAVPGGSDAGVNWWQAETLALTLRLVRIRSVSPSTGEREVAEEVIRALSEGGLGERYAAIGLDPLPDDPWERANAYALLRGASPRTLVLLGHIDTVDTEDYGPLEPYALDPAALEQHLDELAALAPEIAPALAAHPGDWLFGRGVVDMKSGVAANIAVTRHLARMEASQRPPLSVLLVATPDEENASAGVLRAVRLLCALREQHGLEYVGAINTDYTAALHPGDPHHYVYTGTVGKLLPSLLVVGREAHVGEPFAGLDANVLAADLIRDLSMNPDLCERVGDQITPAPVTLHAADLKTRYDVQLPLAAAFSLNVLTFATTPAMLLERLRVRVAATLGASLTRLSRAAATWQAEVGYDVAQDVAQDIAQSELQVARVPLVLMYAELRARVERLLGEAGVAQALADETSRLPDGADIREVSTRMCWRLWRESGLSGPAVVLFYAPPYYPHVAPVESPLVTAVREVAAAHPDLSLRVAGYYPYISDMSYLRIDPGTDLTALTTNMPAWSEPPPADQASAAGGSQRPRYWLPLEEIARLGIPAVNLGPYGAGVHQRSERVRIAYSCGILPQLIAETIARLGAGAD